MTILHNRKASEVYLAEVFHNLPGASFRRHGKYSIFYRTIGTDDDDDGLFG